MIPRTKLEDITEADIQRLIDHGVREGRTLDFKVAAELAKDSRQGLAEDICAFANALGGDLVIGLEPFDKREGDSAAAKAIDPVRVPNLDSTLLDLVSSLRDSLEPRLSTLHAHPVPLTVGGHVIVLRVAASPSAPHRVIRKGGGHFFLRNSVGKEAMDIHAIRTAFAFSQGLTERASAFRDARQAALRDGRRPVPMVPAPTLAVHLIPVTSITRFEPHAIEDLKAAASALQRARPAGYELRSPATNLEGVVCASEIRELNRQHYAYAQLFRDGCIELVSAFAVDQMGDARPIVFPPKYERPLVQYDLPAVFATLAALAIPAPAYLSMSWLGTSGLRVAARERLQPNTLPSLMPHQSEIESPLVYVEDFVIAPTELAAQAIDVLWNAIGIDHTLTTF